MRQRRLVIGVLLGLTVATSGTAACLSYEPAVVVLRGHVERKTFPGAPSFESIESGDQPETGFYLVPDKPLCVKAGKGDYDGPVSDVRLVQLVLDKAGYQRLRPLLGKQVELRGSLFGAVSAHHHTPVLLDKVALEVP